MTLCERVEYVPVDLVFGKRGINTNMITLFGFFPINYMNKIFKFFKSLILTRLRNKDINSTQRYLQMTPELLHEASQRFASYSQWGQLS